MQFPGYWVYRDTDKVVFERTILDETQLDPETNWKQAWQNQDQEGESKGYVEFEAALGFAIQLLSAMEGKVLSPADRERANRFEPVWIDGRCEIRSLSGLLNQQGEGTLT